MFEPQETIHSDSLSVADVPRPRARWREISQFALKFDIDELQEEGQPTTDLELATEESTLPELRYHLYYQQRRWNHFGSRPTPEVKEQVHRILDLIRDKLTPLP